jgi:acetoin utilization deacetylase AcuC-like enzyme
MTAFLHHDLFLKHLEGYNHIESSDRLKAILKKVREGPIATHITFVEARPAEIDWIARVHDRGYIDGITSLAIQDAVVLDWGDTVATPSTPQAALHAAGAGVQAARLVLEGVFPSAFCGVRPPGHHAERGRAMGFCIFNNIAVAASDLLATGGLKRVAIVDWDVHHGNGTESMFAEDDRVLNISLHQYPHYPGSGDEAMRGRGRGEGYTLNLPMGAGAGDREYKKAFEQRVLPALDDFKPEFILISAGFDGHCDDPMSETLLSTGMYAAMTLMLKEIALRHCQGRIVSMLEGGYNLKALAESVEAHLSALAT